MKKLFVLSVLFFSLSMLGQEETSTTPRIAIKLELGSVVKLHNISLKFSEVLEDSRCPKYTTCIWAGRAIIHLEITHKDGRIEDKSIIIGATQGDESSDKTIYRTEGYFIEAVNVNPYPEEGAPTSPYTLLISEGK